MEHIWKFFEDFSCPPAWVVLAWELHSDGDPHAHVVVCLKAKYRSRQPDHLDALFSKHGNYQSAKNVKDVLRYVIKDGDFHAKGIDVNQFLSGKRKRTGVQDEVSKKIRSGADLYSIATEYPGFALVNLAKMVAFKHFCESIPPTLVKARLEPFPLGSPQMLRPDMRSIHSWIGENLFRTEPRPYRSKQLWLYGSSGTGKTTLCMNLSKHVRTYWVNTMESWFDNYPDDTELVVFDEFSGYYTLTFMKQFLCGEPMKLRVKGVAPVYKKGNPAVIICSNQSPQLVYGKASPCDMEALMSRLLTVELSSGDNLDCMQFTPLLTEESDQTINTSDSRDIVGED